MRSVRHIALQFGHLAHFNEGLGEFSRQLGMHLAAHAQELRESHQWQCHYILPRKLHGHFGPDVHYIELHDRMRLRHRLDMPIHVWHGLHQHMRYRPPVGSARSLITVHDLNHVYAKRGLSLWWQNLRLTRQLRRADQLVAISQYAAQDIAKHLPWAPPAAVVPNGVADLTLGAQEAVLELQDTPYLLHISRMSPSKNVESLIDMMAHWPEQTLALVGPQSAEVEAHRARAQSLGLRNVRFVTDVNEAQKAWLYAHCQAFLFPSLMEGFGLPPIEAMYFGKPVIVARRSCLPEVCGDAARYWDTFEPRAMRQAVQACIDEAQARPEHWAQSVRQHALRYTWAQAGQRYIDLYAQSPSPC